MNKSTLKAYAFTCITTVALLIPLLSACSADARDAKRKIEEKSFKVIDTGLEIMSCCSTSSASLGRIAFWLNNDLIAVNAMQDVPDANKKELQRIMLVEAKTGKSRVLLESAELFCWNDERQIASVASVGGEDRITRLINLTNLGSYSELKGSSDLSHHICRSPLLSRPQGAIAASLRESDGYILLSQADNSFDPAKTGVWYRPGMPPVDLEILVDELPERLPQYLAYSGKYLLNKWDSQHNSSTDKRLAGATWKRPYDLTPYRLLSLDGKVEEIPYPYIIFEYGLQYFGELLPTKAGILINNTGQGKGEHGLFLLNGYKLTRIWGGSGWFDKGRGEVATGLQLSPDGCTIVFARYSDWRLTAKKPISLMNLCQEGSQ